MKNSFIGFIYTLFVGTLLYPAMAMGQKKTLEKKATNVSHQTAIPEDCYLNCRVWETPAEFATCDTGWNRFLSESVDPRIARRNGAPPGTYRVEVWFVILKDGSIDTVEPITHLGFGMEEELIRVIHQSPKWRPATHNGRKMSFRLKQSFWFVIMEPLIT